MVVELLKGLVGRKGAGTARNGGGHGACSAVRGGRVRLRGDRAKERARKRKSEQRKSPGIHNAKQREQGHVAQGTRGALRAGTWGTHGLLWGITSSEKRVQSARLRTRFELKPEGIRLRAHK